MKHSVDNTFASFPMQEVAGRKFEENPEVHQHNPVIGKELYATYLCGGYMHAVGKVCVCMGMVLYSACGISLKTIFCRELR